MNVYFEIEREKAMHLGEEDSKGQYIVLHYEKAMTQNCILKKLWHTFGLASKLEFS